MDNNIEEYLNQEIQRYRELQKINNDNMKRYSVSMLAHGVFALLDAIFVCRMLQMKPSLISSIILVLACAAGFLAIKDGDASVEKFRKCSKTNKDFETQLKSLVDRLNDIQKTR